MQLVESRLFQIESPLIQSVDAPLPPYLHPSLFEITAQLPDLRVWFFSIKLLFVSLRQSMFKEEGRISKRDALAQVRLVESRLFQIESLLTQSVHAPLPPYLHPSLFEITAQLPDLRVWFFSIKLSLITKRWPSARHNKPLSLRRITSRISQLTSILESMDQLSIHRTP